MPHADKKKLYVNNNYFNSIKIIIFIYITAGLFKTKKYLLSSYYLCI